MHRSQAFSVTILAALLTGCATAPQTSQVVSNTSSDSHSGSSPETRRLVNQVLPPLVVSANSSHLVDLTAHADDVWDRIRMGFAIPNMDAPVVVEQQAWFLSHPDFLQRAVERSSPYLFHVTEELEKRHMPTELALLPFIESAYNPMAYSRARASGMWQFIPSTGKNFNLKQDWWRDDRRDVVASTDAALNYLDTLYQMHGDWTLALASYNWGEGSVKRAIERNQAQGRPTDYLSLNMPDETRAYFPRLQALKNIIANPAAFGITLPRIDNEPYFVPVTASRDIDVQTAARLADMPVEQFRALNPAFNRPVINGSETTALLLPADRAEAFAARLANEQAPLVNWQAYRVHRGERLDKIAAHFGMSVTALCEANSISARDHLKPGAEILVALHHGASEAAPAATMVANSAPAERRDTHLESRVAPQADTVEVASEQHPGIIRASYSPNAARAVQSSYDVRRGDTLYSISNRFHISVAEIKRLNRLRSNAVQPGENLRIAEADRPIVRR